MSEFMYHGVKLTLTNSLTHRNSAILSSLQGNTDQVSYLIEKYITQTKMECSKSKRARENFATTDISKYVSICHVLTSQSKAP